MAGGLFVLPKMHKITQNSLLKKHGIFCLTFSNAKNIKKVLTVGKKSANISPAVASVAHLVERHLAKVEVASSSLVTRSKKERHDF